MKSDPLKRFRSAFPWAVNLLFYGSVCWIIAIAELPSISHPVFLMREQFLAGNETVFKRQDPGLPYSIFEPHLPRKGRVSFLTDTPYNSKQAPSEQLQSAQGRLAPLFLNPIPVENIALVFCSHNATAATRMQAADYRTMRILGDGKLIAEKIA
ncbi:MAG: hypothetical protein PHV97_07625 [Candidatus Omnitrophica bacterium]|nr:hypothetical protein [Candidatus Omnitrophota bacterium]